MNDFINYERRETLEAELEMGMEHIFQRIKDSPRSDVSRLSLLCIELIHHYKLIATPEKYEAYKAKWLEAVKERSDA